MRNAVIGGFVGTLMAVGVLVACGGGGGGGTQLVASPGRIVVPSGAMAFDPGSATYTLASTGFSWTHNFSGGVGINMSRPVDYGGGDVTVRFVFHKSAAGDGTVAFFVRPRTFNLGDEFADQTAIVGAPVDVSSTPIRTIFQQELVLPAARLQNAIWNIGIQRDSSSTTYTGNVTLYYVELLYTPA